MRPESRVRPEFLAAFRQIAERIEQTLAAAPKRVLPVRMYVAGGAALHFYTGARVSEDVDAVFSHRIALPQDLEVVYRDADGTTRLLYFDRQYNDTLGLMHEDAHADSLSLPLDGIDKSVLDVRLLAPVDLAVSKVGRFVEQDREDIEALARRGLVKVRAFRKRASEAAVAYVGAIDRVQGSIEIACKLIQRAAPRRKRTRKPRPRAARQ